LRATLGGSQSIEERSGCSILLRIVIITEKKILDINNKEKDQG
jgi:hypothetical protein